MSTRQSIYAKGDFITDACSISIGERKATRRDQMIWSVQYDLYASDYRGDKLNKTTLSLCEEAGTMIVPAENLDFILKRHQEVNRC